MIAMAMPSSYFRTILREYANWREKFWREAVQNSVDAGAEHIELGAVDEGSHVRVWCDDDGSGMDEHTLMDVFLVFGGTNKTDDEGKAGGFGKAKELLLMPWIEWRVVSRGIEVCGKHNCKTMPRRVSDSVSGTRIEVLMPKEEATSITYAEFWLAKCTLPWLNVTLVSSRGKSIVSPNLNPGRKVVEFDRADVRHSKDNAHNRLFVRICGLSMFEEWLPDGVNGSICVELKGKSTELLTANRDGLRDQKLADDIRQFVNSIAIDKKSVVDNAAFLTVWNGSGKFAVTARRKRKIDAAQSIIDSSQASLDAASTKEDVSLAVEAAGSLASSLSDGGVAFTVRGTAAKRMLRAVKFESVRQVASAMSTLAWQPDFIIVNHTGKKIGRRFTPEGMSSAAIKLATAWTEICRFVLIQLECSVEFGVGFVFGEPRAAAVTENGQKWLVINPTNEDGSTIKLCEETINELYASAVHECTHIANGISRHDEDFASALTSNFARCGGGWKVAAKIVRDSLAGDPPKPNA